MTTNTRRFINAAIVLQVLWISGAALAADLTIEVKDIRSKEGKLQVAVFDQEAAYDKSDISQSYATLTLPINAENSTFTLHEAPEGRYAVSLFHDENADDKLETGLTGIPKEGYGTSNAANKYDQPSFASASSQLENDDVRLTIQMHYMVNK